MFEDMKYIQEVLAIVSTLKTISTFGNGQTDLQNLLKIGVSLEQQAAAFVTTVEGDISEVKQIIGGDVAAFKKQYPEIFSAVK